MIFNSQVIRPEDVLRGSGMLEIALYGSDDWYNVGAISDLSISENFDLYTSEDDDIYESDILTGQNFKLSFVQNEVLNSDLYSVLRGCDTITEYLSGTDEYVKIESGDTGTINEIKARITTKHNGLNFYVYLHRGNIVSGKSFKYKSDIEDDNRVKQPIEIIFRPDSANSDQIYYTLQPAVYNEKFHKCQGDILTGVTLFVGPSGNMPLDSWTLYDSETYDDSTYSPTAYYQSRLHYNINGFSTLTWTATGDANDIRLSYRVGNDIDTMSDWTTPSNAIGASQTQSIGYRYFQYRFIFYSTAWSDTDSVVVSSLV